MAWLRNITRHDPNFAHATLDDENDVVRPEELIGVFSTVEAATFSIITRRKLGEIGKSERRLTSRGEKYYKWIGPRKRATGLGQTGCKGTEFVPWESARVQRSIDPKRQPELCGASTASYFKKSLGSKCGYLRAKSTPRALG